MAVVEHDHEGLVVVVDSRLHGCRLAQGQGEVPDRRSGSSEVVVAGASDPKRRVVPSESPSTAPTVGLMPGIGTCRCRTGLSRMTGGLAVAACWRRRWGHG